MIIDTSRNIDENFPACLSFVHPGGISGDGQTLKEEVGGRIYDLGGDPPDVFTRTGNYFTHSTNTPAKMDIVAGGQLKLEAPTTATYTAIIVADITDADEITYGYNSTYVYFGGAAGNTDWYINDGAGGDLSLGVATTATNVQAMMVTANATVFLPDHISSGTWTAASSVPIGIAAGSITMGFPDEGFMCSSTAKIYGAALFQFNSWSAGAAARQAILEECNTNWRAGVYTLPSDFAGLQAGG